MIYFIFNSIFFLKIKLKRNFLFANIKKKFISKNVRLRDKSSWVRNLVVLGQSVFFPVLLTALSLLYYIRGFFFLIAGRRQQSGRTPLRLRSRLEIRTFPVFVRARAFRARATDSWCVRARMQNKDLAGR